MYVTMPWMALNYKDIEMLRQLGTVIYINTAIPLGALNVQ